MVRLLCWASLLTTMEYRRLLLLGGLLLLWTGWHIVSTLLTGACSKIPNMMGFYHRKRFPPSASMATLYLSAQFAICTFVADFNGKRGFMHSRQALVLVVNGIRAASLKCQSRALEISMNVAHRDLMVQTRPLLGKHSIWRHQTRFSQLSMSLFPLVNPRCLLYRDIKKLSKPPP